MYKVRLSHLFSAAPPAVIEAVAHILFSRLYRHETPCEALHRYHLFIENNRSVFEQRLRESYGPSRPHEPHGAHYNLEKIFDRLNRTYFHPRLVRPKLCWSRKKAQVKLGEYLSLHRLIVINRRFDDPDTPHFVVEYLVYHEMLHMKHPVTIRNGRRIVHTRPFSEDEKRFKDFGMAREWIHKMSGAEEKKRVRGLF
ncbi:MAG: M48 family peptidase [Acidobacteriia bacterium]|nr:M48 family peptidase [Terriglobia bacterium]